MHIIKGGRYKFNEHRCQMNGFVNERHQQKTLQQKSQRFNILAATMPGPSSNNAAER